jgi:HAD superfamily hydrolase (TIGR01484 family)
VLSDRLRAGFRRCDVAFSFDNTMRYLALVVDYDGTLALHDRLSDTAALALGRLRVSGRRAILVTGRRLSDLMRVCPQLQLFDMVVAENGAVVHDPRSRESRVLAKPPSRRLVERLIERGVEPLEAGTVVVATKAPAHTVVLEVIRELGLELQLIFNRDSTLVLPAGVNKASGLEVALSRLGLSRHEVVGIGDAENDHSFLAHCECAVAVANAVPAVKERADVVTEGANGEGVAELIDELIATDLRRLEGMLPQHLIRIGTRADATPVCIPPYGRNLLIAGPSSSGKSTLAAGIIERLTAKEYQVCIIDPEGDYGALPDLAALGNQRSAPSINEILSILEDPRISVSVNLWGIPLADRPAFFAQLIPSLHALRTRTGRPHWLVLDEAHHMLPATWGHTGSALPYELGETIFITVHPDHVAPQILSAIDVVLAIGPGPDKTLGEFAAAIGQALMWPQGLRYARDRVVAWFAHDGALPFSMRPERGRAERIRHLRKYAEGNLGWHSFYFRGPDARHNLKAQNLGVFCQMAEGIDEATWLFHLRRGDYSRWFRGAIKDGYLADEAERIERRPDLSAQQTRALIRELVHARYTLPE